MEKKTTKCMLNFKTSTEKQNKSEEKKLKCMLKLKSNSHSLKKKTVFTEGFSGHL